MVLEPLNKIKTRLLLKETARAISSPDKYEIINGKFTSNSELRIEEGKKNEKKKHYSICIPKQLSVSAFMNDCSS